MLEETTVRLLEAIGVDRRMRREGLVHEGFSLSVDGEAFRIDLKGLTGGETVMVYGQTEITHDLYEAAEARDCRIVFEAEDVALHDLDGDEPTVTWRLDGSGRRTAARSSP